MMHMTHKTHAQEAVALRTGRDLGELLTELYVTKELSQEDVARELGVTRLTVARWLLLYRISRDDRPAVAL